MRKNLLLKYLPALFLAYISMFSCNQEKKERFKIEIKPTENIEIINLSEEFFNSNIPIEDFKAKYPWFQGNISDAEYALRRKDTAEIKIYREAVEKIDLTKLNTELSEMFSRVKHYFPKFKTPKIYLYSSNLQSITDPIFFRTQEGMLFVDISAFMGEKNKNYEGIDFYLRKSMNPGNLVPKISEVVAESFIIINPQENKFIDQILLNGKIKILQDAFLPYTPDHLKMDYTEEQQNWAEANEENIWNYFVENDLLFSDDSRLYERFIAIGPFSKFYTEVDQKSSPKVGVFIGLKIAKAFLHKNLNAKLSDFLTMNATDIFNQSNYTPQN